MRAREMGLACGSLPPGKRNTIADVPGVLVGHTTLIEGDIRTGVTAILPHDGDLFQDKPVAAIRPLRPDFDRFFSSQSESRLQLQ